MASVVSRSNWYVVSIAGTWSVRIVKAGTTRSLAKPKTSRTLTVVSGMPVGVGERVLAIPKPGPFVIETRVLSLYVDASSGETSSGGHQAREKYRVVSRRDPSMG